MYVFDTVRTARHALFDHLHQCSISHNMEVRFDNAARIPKFPRIVLGLELAQPWEIGPMHVRDGLVTLCKAKRGTEALSSLRPARLRDICCCIGNECAHLSHGLVRGGTKTLSHQHTWQASQSSPTYRPWTTTQ